VDEVQSVLQADLPRQDILPNSALRQATKAERANQNAGHLRSACAASSATMDTQVAPPPRRARRQRILLTVAGFIVGVLIVAIVVAHHYWPFTESAVRSALADDASAHVTFGKFRDTYFPPGCVAENVSFQRDNSPAPLITIRRLTIRSYLAGILRKHVSLVRAEGVHILVTGADVSQTHPTGEQHIVDRLIADDAVFEIRRSNPQQNLHFVFHKFMLKNLGGTGPVSSSAVFDNPSPPGLVSIFGQFGPWGSSHWQDTPVSGKYSFQHADLSAFDGIAGILASSGNFRGTFKQIDIDGSTDTPEFEVTKTHHHLPLNTRFTASVDAGNGNVLLHKVLAHFGHSDLTVKGTVGRGPNGKRAAILDLQCERGRIEDAFYPFTHNPRSPLVGDVAFTMRITIPGGHEPFLEKLELVSNFQIQHAQFTRDKTQQELNTIAENPGQKQPDQTLADFQGSVAIHHGVAYFSSLSVEDQGAAARFHGSYNLVNEKVRMFGQLKTATSLTKTTHGGISAVFAKVLEPFFKKRPHVTVVPVKIGGTYTKPSFGLDM